MPPIQLQDLRHTHATLLLLDREPVHVVSQRLGHASAVVTMTVYAHVLPGSHREAADRSAALVGVRDDAQNSASIRLASAECRGENYNSLTSATPARRCRRWRGCVSPRRGCWHLAGRETCLLLLYFFIL